ncbi:MarR family transcriptional regulator [Halobacteriaceae archaeon GCM10025711]
MVNRDYSPTDDDEKVLSVLKGGRANPLLIRQETNLSKQRVNHSLSNLVAAGWVTRITTGLYELVEDPREGSNA